MLLQAYMYKIMIVLFYLENIDSFNVTNLETFAELASVRCMSETHLAISV